MVISHRLVKKTVRTDLRIIEISKRSERYMKIDTEQQMHFLRFAAQVRL